MLENFKKLFAKDQPLERLSPFYNAVDGIFYTCSNTTTRAPYVRDIRSLKRVIFFVIMALLPATVFGMYNVGLQIEIAKGMAHSGWRALGMGADIVVPIILVSYLVGGFWEVMFACIRRKPVSEGFFVTGLLFALTLPPTIPLWQVAVGISFAVVVGKEVFGGTGRNIVNPAIAGRAFLFFSYPSQLSGTAPWVAVDGFTHATPMAKIAASPVGSSAMDVLNQAGYSVSNLFWGTVPGSIGETSKFACLAGLVILLVTGVTSWRVIVGCLTGALAMAALVFMLAGPHSPAIRHLAPYGHLLVGGLAFGMIFMCADPVTSCATNTGKWIYGILTGALIIFIRTFNPAYPESVMLVILLMNVFAPLIDHVVVEKHIHRSLHRAKAR